MKKNKELYFSILSSIILWFSLFSFHSFFISLSSFLPCSPTHLFTHSLFRSLSALFNLSSLPLIFIFRSLPSLFAFLPPETLSPPPFPLSSHLTRSELLIVSYTLYSIYNFSAPPPPFFPSHHRPPTPSLSLSFETNFPV